MLSDPEKRQHVRHGRGPVRRAAGAGGAAGSARGFPFSDIMDAFFGQGTQRADRAAAPAAAGTRPSGSSSTCRRRRSATTRELTVDTAVVCSTCTGEGTAPGTHPDDLRHLQRPGRGQQVTRSFLGQVDDGPALPAVRRLRHGHPHPCPECVGDGRVRTRRTIKVRIPAGVEDGTHIQLAGEGEVGPGGGPAGDLFLEIVERPHAIFERRGRRPALHGRAPDDRGRARHHRDGRDAGRPGRASTSGRAPSPGRSSRCTARA